MADTILRQVAITNPLHRAMIFQWIATKNLVTLLGSVPAAERGTGFNFAMLIAEKQLNEIHNALMPQDYRALALNLVDVGAMEGYTWEASDDASYVGLAVRMLDLAALTQPANPSPDPATYGLSPAAAEVLRPSGLMSEETVQGEGLPTEPDPTAASVEQRTKTKRVR